MLKVLIIEDDVEFRTVLKDMLERKGFEVYEASEGEEGIKVYNETPTEVVITDIIMPNKEGMETIIEFKRDFPDAKIIAMSGGGKGAATSYLKAASLFPNVKYTFQKPFPIADLLKVVESLVS